MFKKPIICDFFLNSLSQKNLVVVVVVVVVVVGGGEAVVTLIPGRARHLFLEEPDTNCLAFPGVNSP